ncbi:MAG: Cna B-type domain-containing protein [Clostridia bacterium]|nr:Cna B-type domain-containing protein [Clostridia bacterium]
MRKKIIAFLLVAVIVIGITPLMSLAEESDTVTAVRGDTTYALTADPDTGTVPDGFGTVSNNGRIWTDKSVEIVDDRFDVNLKVLAQEYISTSGSGNTTSIAADVVMIFDMTNSMVDNTISKGNTTVTRLEGLVDSANEAIDIITSTNPNNRIVIYGYYGTSTTYLIDQKPILMLPLGHYTSTITGSGTTGKYLVYNNKKIQTSSGLLKDGEPVQSQTWSTGTGTGTQFGIAFSIDGLIQTINSETDNSIQRKPYVILMTDGEPDWASKNWFSETKTDYVSNSASGGCEIAAATILTAAQRKDKLAAAYTAYNDGKDYGVEWFNIGLGLAEPTDPANAKYTAVMMNPSLMLDVNPVASSSDHREATKYLIGANWAAPAYTDKDYSADGNYVYVNPGDGYVKFANTYDVLMNAFTTLAQIIQQGSMEVTFPIIIHEGSGEQASDVVFTDVLGEGMYITDVTLTPDGVPPVTGEDDGNGNYTFPGYDTTVTVAEDANGQQTLVWRLPAKEVAMFTFADRENVTNGQYVSAEPTKLTYGVDFTYEIDEGPGYTNAFDSGGNPLTTVTYEIPGDNNYYYDIVLDNLANFVSSTLKTNVNESTPKTENITESAANSSDYVYTASNDGTIDSYAAVEGKLGNNGKATFLERKEEIDITVEKKWEDRTGNIIDDTSGLPPVTVTLYRQAQDSTTEETVETITLSDSNGYTADYTLPVRDTNNRRYTYYIHEDCPDGYYTVSTSPPITADDGTLTVINREFPEEGAIAVRKQWKNKIGADISGSPSLQPIDVSLKRHVTVTSPTKHTVTIYCTDITSNNLSQYARTYEVAAGSQISFKMRMYIRYSSNGESGTGNAVLTLNGTEIPSTASSTNTDTTYEGNTVNIQTKNYRETDLQTFTVNSDLDLHYACNKKINIETMPYNGVNPYMVRELVKTDPQSTEDVIVTQGDDEVYETFTLNRNNNWQHVVDDLPIVVNDSTTGNIYEYSYFVEELSEVPGFVASYSDNNTEGVEGGVITITNTSTSAIGILPETGGRGSPPIVLAGAVTIMFAIAFMFIGLSPGRRRRHRKRTI